MIDKKILDYCCTNFPDTGIIEYKKQNGRYKAKGSENVPNQPGIYLFFAHKNSNKELVYIGKAGSLNNEEQNKFVWGGQGLKNRILTAQREKKKRGLEYYKDKIKKFQLSKIKVFWYVTYNKNIKLIPDYIEGQLIQMYYQLSGYKKLPKWNKRF